jgi:pimeloyl-ACP methyl ester carboxylesterase
MVRDARALLDHLGLDGVHFLGYSMGSFIGMSLAPAEPRVASLVLGGAGVAQIRSRAAGGVLRIAEALEVADPAEAVDERGRAFRNFADATKADRLALAASLRVDGSFPKLEDLATITVPTLVLNGLKDTMTGPPEDLAQLIPGARYQSVPGDHLSAVVQPEFRQAVVAFLDSL